MFVDVEQPLVDQRPHELTYVRRHLLVATREARAYFRDRTAAPDRLPHRSAEVVEHERVEARYRHDNELPSNPTRDDARSRANPSVEIERRHGRWM